MKKSNKISDHVFILEPDLQVQDVGEKPLLGIFLCQVMLSNKSAIELKAALQYTVDMTKKLVSGDIE